MKELNLLLQLPKDVSTRYRSVDMTVLAAYAISFCQRHCVSLCKGTKAPEFGLRRILGLFAGFLLLRLETPVLLAALCKSSRILQSRILGEFAGSRLGTWHAVSGFGLGFLVRQGFLGAKAPLDPLCHAFLI